MADGVTAVSAADTATASDAGSSDGLDLEQVFQDELVKAGLFMIENMQSDMTEEFNDESSNPEAPF